MRKTKAEKLIEKEALERRREQIKVNQEIVEQDLIKTDLLLFRETDNNPNLSFGYKLAYYKKICKKKTWNAKYCAHCDEICHYSSGKVKVKSNDFEIKHSEQCVRCKGIKAFVETKKGKICIPCLRTVLSNTEKRVYFDE